MRPLAFVLCPKFPCWSLFYFGMFKFCIELPVLAFSIKMYFDCKCSFLPSWGRARNRFFQEFSQYFRVLIKFFETLMGSRSLTVRFSGGALPLVPWHLMDNRPLQPVVRRPAQCSESSVERFAQAIGRGRPYAVGSPQNDFRSTRGCTPRIPSCLARRTPAHRKTSRAGHNMLEHCTVARRDNVYE